jgi:hypothetical protein
LSSLFSDEIHAHVPLHRERFVLHGPEVLLTPAAFSAMGLVIHELVTNSSKYGALSAHGRVDVFVDHAGNGAHLRWLESGGPTVAPPSRRGFGSVVIERVIPFDLQGRAEVHYHASGLEASFFVPQEFIATAVLTQTGGQPLALAWSDAAPRIKPLSGRTALLLEDNLIAALEAEDMLKDFGAETVWTVATVEGARQVLIDHAPGFAMLDVNVGSENSFGLAAEISGRGVPYLFASGYGDGLPSDAQGVTAPVVVKPYERNQLCAAICAVMSEYGGRHGCAG